MKSHIVARLPGGLGNQLFVFVAGLYFSGFLHWPLKVDLSRIDRKHGEESIKDFLEENFKKYVFEWRERERLKYFTIRWEATLQKSNQRYRKTLFLGDEDLHTSERKLLGLQSELRSKEKKVKVILDGYFQNFTFFDILKLDLIPNLSQLISIGNSSLSQERDEGIPNTCCIHIRLGDFYSELRNSLGVLNLDYYRKAIMKLMSFDANMEFHIFSNDIKLARILYAELSEFNVKWKENSEPKGKVEKQNSIEVLNEMTKYKNFILSNSTFSFWSAKLATGTRFVLYPSPMYFRSSFRGIGGLPRHWTSLSAEFLRNDE